VSFALLLAVYIWNVSADQTCQPVLHCIYNLATVLTVQSSNAGGQYPDPVQKRYLFTEVLRVVHLGPMSGQMHRRYSQSRCTAVVLAAAHGCSLSFPADSVLPESGAESAA